MKTADGIASAKTVRDAFSTQLLRSVVIIGIIGGFCAALLFSMWGVARTRILNMAGEEFSETVFRADRYLEQMKYTLAEISMDSSMYALADGTAGEDFDTSKVIEVMRSSVFSRKQNEFVPYLQALFAVPKAGYDNIIDSGGVFRRDMFFTAQYKSRVYSDEFWREQLNEDFIFKIYPASGFESSRDTALSSKKLTPVAYKVPENNNFAIVGLVDILGAFPENTNVAMFDNEGNLLVTRANEQGFSTAYSEWTQPCQRINGGYAFKVSSASQDVTYYSWISAGELYSGINTGFAIIALMLIAIIALCLFISLRFANRDSRTVEQISRAIMDSGVEIKGSRVNLDFVKSGVEKLLDRNEECIREITQKDLLLKEVFLQSRMRDIYVSIDDVENQINISKKFVLICFRVNYREQFHQNIDEDQGKISFFLKQLIELYLSNAGLDATTFQVERDQIVSVVNMEGTTGKIPDIMEGIIAKLNNESEYVFFTVVISESHENIANLKRVYDQMYAISRYARPVLTETQVLLERDIKPGAGRFYFSVEQMEKLTAMLQNESPEDALHFMDEILDYNIKKEVNGFDLYLLCTEIVNCAVKLVNRLFQTTPASMRIAETYSRLDKSVSLHQYRSACAQLIEQAVDYIRINKREEDYIISFIIDYVENHYTEDIYLNLFAEKLKLTPAYISSYFKEKMDVNLIDYINSYRIKKAVALVEDSQNPLLKNKEIAEKVGIQNINTFIRLFKKYTGFTPGEYRKKHVGE